MTSTTKAFPAHDRCYWRAAQTSTLIEAARYGIDAELGQAMAERLAELDSQTEELDDVTDKLDEATRLIDHLRDELRTVEDQLTETQDALEAAYKASQAG